MARIHRIGIAPLTSPYFNAASALFGTFATTSNLGSTSSVIFVFQDRPKHGRNLIVAEPIVPLEPISQLRRRDLDGIRNRPGNAE